MLNYQRVSHPLPHIKAICHLWVALAATKPFLAFFAHLECLQSCTTIQNGASNIPHFWKGLGSVRDPIGDHKTSDHSDLPRSHIFSNSNRHFEDFWEILRISPIFLWRSKTVPPVTVRVWHHNFARCRSHLSFGEARKAERCWKMLKDAERFPKITWFGCSNEILKAIGWRRMIQPRKSPLTSLRDCKRLQEAARRDSLRAKQQAKYLSWSDYVGFMCFSSLCKVGFQWISFLPHGFTMFHIHSISVFHV